MVGPICRRARVARRLAAVALVGALGAGAGAGYTVRAGDTLSGIAARLGVSVSALAAANHVADPNEIQIGQTLAIPSIPGPGSLPAALLAHPSRLALRPSFRRWGRAYQVSPALVEALAWMESGWQTKVVSPTGAIGIGQLEPATVNFVCTQLLGVKLSPWNADQNIRMTARFLRYLLDQTGGNVTVALAGYYQGLTSVRAKGMLAETRNYVTVITQLVPAFSPG